jgi:hypothetical protein
MRIDRVSTRGDEMHTGASALCVSRCPPPRTTAADLPGDTAMLGQLGARSLRGGCVHRTERVQQ